MATSVGSGPKRVKVKLAKGDLVQAMAGRSSRERGKVLQIDRQRRRVLVEGLNIVKKHKKAQREGEQGEIVSVEAFMDISNVMFVCPTCSRPSRIGYRGTGKSKQRICRRCERQL